MIKKARETKEEDQYNVRIVKPDGMVLCGKINEDGTVSYFIDDKEVSEKKFQKQMGA